jgi:hypothetical protein
METSAVVYAVRFHRSKQRYPKQRFIAELEDTGRNRAFKSRRKAVKWAEKHAHFVVNFWRSNPKCR